MAARLDVLTEHDFRNYIKHAPQGSVITKITPEMAKLTLSETNKKNRPFSSAKVIDYSKDMQNENWSLNGETIKFGSDGLLKDGQHRLEACVRANTAFGTHLVFGIDPETFQHIDIGKLRNGSDTLAMMNVPNSKDASTVIKMIISYENGLSRSPSAGVSNDWIKEKYNNEIDHALLQEAISVGRKLYTTTKWRVGIVGAFFYVAVQKGQREQISQFLDHMCKGIGKARAPVPFLLTNVNRMRIDRAFHLTAHHYSIMLSRSFYNFKVKKASTKADITVSMNDKMVAF
tara:strand:+ start:1365 stop:2228 length:864 start_codon:yes stop_codon:yes gene_type:complete